MGNVSRFIVFSFLFWVASSISSSAHASASFGSFNRCDESLSVSAAFKADDSHVSPLHAFSPALIADVAPAVVFKVIYNIQTVLSYTAPLKQHACESLHTGLSPPAFFRS
jgi:hypothetical protein